MTPVVAEALHSNSRTLWYVTRGSGLIALLLLTVTMLLGILNVQRFKRPSWPRFATQEFHRTMSLLVLVFLAIHIVTSVLDSFAPIHLVDILIPFAGRYRALWLGLGTLSFDLLLAVTLTSLIRTRLGHRTWRTVHWAAYGCWPVALLHGLGTGSDTKIGWVFGVYLVCLLIVVGALWWRIGAGWPSRAAVRVPAAVASIMLPIAVVGFAAAGPLAKGWATRAGTPANLLPHHTAAASTPTSTPRRSTAVTALPSPPFTANVAGTLSQQGPDSSGLITLHLNMTLSSNSDAHLLITLHGEALPTGGVRLAHGALALGTSKAPNTYQGPVTGLNGDQIDAQVQDARGGSLAVSVRVSIDGVSVHGVVSVGTGGR
jgi:hypothetical protein